MTEGGNKRENYSCVRVQGGFFEITRSSQGLSLGYLHRAGVEIPGHFIAAVLVPETFELLQFSGSLFALSPSHLGEST